jgi:hypothetical protein
MYDDPQMPTPTRQPAALAPRDALAIVESIASRQFAQLFRRGPSIERLYG